MRPSPQAEQFKSCLPEDLQAVAEVSFSYQRVWRIVCGHLHTLYGKFADPQYCLEAYYNSAIYRGNAQIIRRCPDIPLIDFEDITQMLNEEEAHNQVMAELLALRELTTAEAIYRKAFLLGLMPEENPCALYRHLVAKQNLTALDKQEILQKMESNFNLLTVVVDALSEHFVSGHLREYPATGSVVTQQRSRYYYRGEHAYFRKSVASAYRALNTEKPASIQAFIDRLRLYQCWDTLDSIDAVKQWRMSESNYMALAQHYGFHTCMIDITSDLKTALFFACCTFGEDRKWRPLTQQDFSHRNARPGISKRGGDSRYGILYRSPVEITDLRWCTEPDDTGFEVVIPVGYQPFMRCSQQHGYMLLTQPDYDLFRDKRFDKFKFRLTEELCNWIFEEMDQGASVYPNKDVPDISMEIESLNKQTVFSKYVFEEAVNDFRSEAVDTNTRIQVLNHYGFQIEDTVSAIAPEKCIQINQEYSLEKAEQMAGVSPLLSPILTI